MDTGHAARAGATPDDVRASYDAGNEFFRLWLDAGMSYTGALYAGDEPLEAAQRRKLAWLADAAGVTPGSAVLDIGCGWGACLEYLATERGVARGQGISLSPAQIAEVRRRAIPGVEVEHVSYLDYRPQEPFDALVSIGMLEHVVSPDEAREGRAVEIYRRYFRRAHGFTRPGARFGLQTIVRARIPRIAADARELGWATRVIFPGSIAPRLEDLVVAVAPCWEILELRTGRDDYRRTCAAWLSRLEGHEAEIRARFGDARFEEYRRYLAACVHSFAMGYVSLCRFALVRQDADQEDGGCRNRMSR
jgi:cyclopropane-fatty-acyl-phospholipid synthase